MSEQENIKVIHETYAAFQRGDIEALVNGCTEDTQWFFPGPSGVIPYSREYNGREDLAKFFSVLDDVEEVDQFEPKEFFAKGDKVVVLGVYGGKVRSNGREFKNEDWAHVFELKNGKIARFREYIDTARVVERLQAGRGATAS